MKLLVTGGAGFIGSNFIRYWLKKYPNDKITNLDKLTYAGRHSTTKDFSSHKNYNFVKGDICKKDDVKKAIKGIDYVINFAAESHNDRAVKDPEIFVRTNILGAQVLLEEAKFAKVKRFHHISTCEVFGDLPLNSKKSFSDNDVYRPRTPYNASKAGSDHVVSAYFHTYGLPITISHCSNNYGPFQFPEKIIPRFITNLIYDQKIPLFKSSQNRREWIHVDDHNSAVDLILKEGNFGESYNIGTGVEKSIEDIADLLLQIFDKPKSYKKYVPDRLGHDKRYLLNSTKIRRELKWKPEYNFDSGLKSTVQWYRENRWWKPLKKKAESIYEKK
jgi:dTDP-glucose 4,6-dehydratase